MDRLDLSCRPALLDGNSMIHRRRRPLPDGTRSASGAVSKGFSALWTSPTGERYKVLMITVVHAGTTLGQRYIVP